MGGRCVVMGALLQGVEATPVEVEVVVSMGLAAFNVVGMADAAVQESRQRVQTALKQAGFRMPGDRIIVNLAPSSLKKTGSGFDLPIALGILAATGQIDAAILKGNLFAGELSLDGHVRSVPGLLAYALCARDHGYNLVCSAEPSGLLPVEGLSELGLESLGALRTKGYEPIDDLPSIGDVGFPDFQGVSGNEVAKRALQIAAAGDHGVLMMGPPGSGKTMLASCMPSILPPLTQDEMLQCAIIHSVAGLDVSQVMQGIRPFRSPHHSSTGPSLIGGGRPVGPGEASLAHHGVLFLDELAEFKPSVLQQIRQPLEEGTIRISRAEGTFTFPAHFMLVAASNPCPCGFFGDEDHECTCQAFKVQDYQSRIGGPLMDRIDIHIDVKRVEPGEVIEARRGTSSEELRRGVMAAREFASWRRQHERVGDTSQELVASCHLSSQDEAFFEKAARGDAMSGRGIIRTLSVARTIADMDERLKVERSDLYEALGFRVRVGART